MPASRLTNAARFSPVLWVFLFTFGVRLAVLIAFSHSSHFLPGSDERMRNTVEAISSELTENGFVLRYVTGETDDGLSGKEGTFLICSFWLVSSLAIVGRMREANDLMERLLRVSSPLGLYAEEFEVDRARHLGNFPQAFSHLALIEAAARIILADRLEELSL